eukprot:TRINITY_DN52415_c0_g1_i1.p1 TRINITY_DN52415_c0_g1~~TRINITY_DN52415_c0_g1_i1.p1  ORF type:complete len:170 (+),score=47.81 TRINITY_DN52415_c0_g1_i1:91-600(+)
MAFDWKSSLVPEVKNTFIHFQEAAEGEFLLPQSTLRRTASEPTLLEAPELPLPSKHVSSSWAGSAASSTSASGAATPKVCTTARTSGAATPTSMEDKIAEHRLGTCKPCGYLYFKADGCRMGDACEFCHLCTEEDAKEKKRSCKKQARSAKRVAACIARAAIKGEPAMG